MCTLINQRLAASVHQQPTRLTVWVKVSGLEKVWKAGNAQIMREGGQNIAWYGMVWYGMGKVAVRLLRREKRNQGE